MHEKPLRIAQIVGKVVISGVDSVVMNYYRHIDKNEIQFDFFMDGYEKSPLDEEIQDLGGNIIKLTPYEKSMVQNMHDCKVALKKNNYKIVHSHLNTLSIFPLASAWQLGIPVRIAHNHSTSHKGEFKRNLMKNALRPFSKLFATHYAACANYPAQWLFGKNTVNNNLVKIIPNAVDTKRFYPNAVEREKIRKEFNIEKNFIIGHVGRFVYPKNHEFIVRAFADVYKKDNTARLMLVGEGELLPTIKNLIQHLHIEQAVIFTGLRRDIPDILNAFDLFLLPSHYEGLPVVGVEAQSCGTPSLMSTNVPTDVAITPLAHFFSLNNPISEWTQKILSFKNLPKTPYPNEIQKAGFDIYTAAKNLEQWYKLLAKLQ